MNKGGFSLARLLGISSAKSRLSRALGIPLTKGGRTAKLGRAVKDGDPEEIVEALVISLIDE